jgi:hypothetical protein
VNGASAGGSARFSNGHSPTARVPPPGFVWAGGNDLQDQSPQTPYGSGTSDSPLLSEHMGRLLVITHNLNATLSTRTRR